MRWRPKVWHASLDRSREQPRFFSYSEPTVTTKSTSASQGGPVDPVWYPLDLADCTLEPTARRGGVESSHDSPLERNGFELVWGFSCQVVIFGFLAILCSERECRSSSRRLRSGSRSARKGSRDRNA